MKEKIKEWIKCAGIRAIKTVCQTAIATIGTTTMFNQVDWKVVGYSSLLAGILSLLTSLAGLPELEAKEVQTTFNEDDLENIDTEGE